MIRNRIIAEDFLCLGQRMRVASKHPVGSPSDRLCFSVLTIFFLSTFQKPFGIVRLLIGNSINTEE